MLDKSTLQTRASKCQVMMTLASHFQLPLQDGGPGVPHHPLPPLQYHHNNQLSPLGKHGNHQNFWSGPNNDSNKLGEPRRKSCDVPGNVGFTKITVRIINDSPWTSIIVLSDHSHSHQGQSQVINHSPNS